MNRELFTVLLGLNSKLHDAIAVARSQDAWMTVAALQTCQAHISRACATYQRNAADRAPLQLEMLAAKAGRRHDTGAA